jgi:hypothetical protein
MYNKEQTELIFSNILLEIEKGRALRNVLNDADMPSSKTFYNWLESDEDKVKRYARACELRADTIFEDILDIADDSSKDITTDPLGNERLNTEFVQRARLRVDARKWIVSKLNPKKYGDKIENTHLGEMSIKWQEVKTYDSDKETD